MIFDYRTDWGQKFEKLAQLYRGEVEGDEDTEDDSPNKPSRSPAFLPHESSSSTNVDEDHRSPPSPAPSSPSSSLASSRRSSYLNERTHVPVTRSTVSKALASVLQSKSCGSVPAPSYPAGSQREASTHSSHKSSRQKADAPSVSTSLAPKAPATPHLHKQQLHGQTLSSSKESPDPSVTTINNLYTNPAQRSSTSTRTTDAATDKTVEASKEPVVNGHVGHSNPSLKQCSEKSAALSSAGNKKADKKVSVVGKSGKGVETWC